MQELGAPSKEAPDLEGFVAVTIVPPAAQCVLVEIDGESHGLLNY